MQYTEIHVQEAWVGLFRPTCGECMGHSCANSATPDLDVGPDAN